jgi:CO/xanthine dehydrogenase Mo-binding subunit
MFVALPVDTVRYVGEPIAVVVADNPRVARAAAELVTAEFDELPALRDITVFLDGDRADTDGETPAHLRRHLVAENRFRCGDPDVMLAEAPHRLAATFRMQRSSTAPLEPRGYVASWDGASWDDPSGRLTVHASHQQPFQLRSQLARMLDLPEESVRVVVPKVGGRSG